MQNGTSAMPSVTIRCFLGGFLCSERELGGKKEKKAGAVCEHCTTGVGSADVWAPPLMTFLFLPFLTGASGKYTSGPKNCGIHFLHSLASYCRYCPNLLLTISHLSMLQLVLCKSCQHCSSSVSHKEQCALRTVVKDWRKKKSKQVLHKVVAFFVLE